MQNETEKSNTLVSKSLPMKPTIFISFLFSMSKAGRYVLPHVKTSDRFLTNASSISIQNIQLGYTFSKKTLRSLYLTNLRIYVACDNVYYWSKRKGFDSRVTWNGNKDSSGEYSAVRAFSAGLSLQF